MDNFSDFLKEQNAGDDIYPVITSNFNDADYIKQLSHAKRFLELFTMYSKFKEEVQKGNEEVLAAYSLDVSLEDMQYLYDEEKILKFKDNLKELPQIVRRYRSFIHEKLAYRNNFLKKECEPSNNLFRIWRQRQVNRCWGELGFRNHSIIHTPLLFELSKGCSVGCQFCGVSAERLSKVFHYTPENSKLWLDILNKCKEIIGPSAGTGTCYLATEPLDNPDYEKFSLDYYHVFGKLPQITTAVADKNIERLKTFFKNTQALYPCIHRFSILSLKALETILAAFSPEELLYVELLPQFKEAPAATFASAGRAFNNKVFSKEKESVPLGETIACVTGFVVNMAEKTLRLTTPCGTDKEHPTGEINIAQATFEDALDFEEALNALIKKHMIKHIPSTLPLKLQPYYVYQPAERGFLVSSGNGSFKASFQDEDNACPDIFQEIGQLLTTKEMSAQELVTELYINKNFEPSLVYHNLNKLYNAGVLIEHPN